MPKLPRKTLADKLRLAQTELRKAEKNLPAVKVGGAEWEGAKRYITTLKARITRLTNQLKK